MRLSRGVWGTQDLENTAGSWDLYGQQDERRYPGLQAEFFERAAGPLTRRESVYAFVAASMPFHHHWQPDFAHTRMLQQREDESPI